MLLFFFAVLELAIVSLTNVGRSSATGIRENYAIWNRAVNIAASNRAPDQCRLDECYGHTRKCSGYIPAFLRSFRYPS